MYVFDFGFIVTGRKIEGSKLKKNNIYVVKEEKLQVTGRWIWEGNKVVNFELEEGDNVEVNGGGSKWQGKKINQFNARDGKLMVWFFFFQMGWRVNWPLCYIIVLNNKMITVSH